MIVSSNYTKTKIGQIPEFAISYDLRETMGDLFDTWAAVRTRNRRLTRYYEQKNSVKNLGISIPPPLDKIEEAVGWAAKAIDVRVHRSKFYGYVYRGTQNTLLEELSDQNDLRELIKQATTSMLLHGVAFLSVMKGDKTQAASVVRAFSANQACALWDKDRAEISAAIITTRINRNGQAAQYVVHKPDEIITYTQHTDDYWTETREPNPLGTPLIIALVHNADLDKPLGHSVLTEEILTTIDKAQRDLLRLDVGSEFFTAPQRYILGATEDLFTSQTSGDADDEQASLAQGKLKAYLGSLLAITRDESGEVPQVGQFPAGDAGNFIRVFEADAQRFSGASCVPLAQLGVLGNNYTSSDALGAANDPLIIAVESMNNSLKKPLRKIARLMLAIAQSKRLDELTQEELWIEPVFEDPAKPTLSARADAWSKIIAMDKSLVGLPTTYEKLGFSQNEIDRIRAEKTIYSATDALNAIADELQTQSVSAWGEDDTITTETEL